MVSSSASATMTPETVDRGNPQATVFCCRDPIISRRATIAAAAAGVTGFPAQDAWLRDDNVFVPGRASIWPGSHPAAMHAVPSINFVLCSSIDDGAGAHEGKHPSGDDDGRSSTLHRRCCPSRCTNHPAPHSPMGSSIGVLASIRSEMRARCRSRPSS